MLELSPQREGEMVVCACVCVVRGVGMELAE